MFGFMFTRGFLGSQLACSPIVEEQKEKEDVSLPPKEERGPIKIVRLSGHAYEMGVQHGELLFDELEKGAEFIAEDPLLGGMLFLAQQQGLLDFAYTHSDPRYLEECSGMASVTDIVGWTMDHCMLLNFGDVIIERLLHPPEETPGCSQIVALSERSASGSVLHGRLLDWAQIDFILENPVIFVREPDDGIPHVIIGFPSNLSAYQGMNLAGISIASNEAHPLDTPLELLSADSHVQEVGNMLAHVQSLEEAKDWIAAVDHASTESIVVVDGNQDKAHVFEMSHSKWQIREPQEGILFQTNHFVGSESSAWDNEPVREDSLKRYERLEELLVEPTPQDLFSMRELLRDRIDPWTQQESPLGTFDDGNSLATNGALFAVLFEPSKGHFYVASGGLPVPEQPWLGFSLHTLLGIEDPHGAPYDQLELE